MKRLLGGILLAVGILIAGASGLCTGTMVVIALHGGNIAGLLLFLVIGGVPFLAGVGLCLAGRALIRSADDENRWRR